MAGQTTGFPARYNPLQLQSDTRTWRDTNGDNIAQANEIGASNNAAFGLPVQTIRPDADIKREYDLEYTAQVQHELIRGLSVNLGLFRRGTHNQRLTQNLGWTPADYTIVNVVSPLDGSVIPVYNLDPAKRANVNRLDVNSTDSDLRAPQLQRLPGGLQRARPWLPVLRRLDDGSDHRYPLRCDREQRWPAMPAPRAISGQQLPATRLSLLRPEQARPAVPARVQARRVVHAAVVRHPGERRAPELQRPAVVHALEHRTDHAVRGQLRWTVPTGRAGHPEPDARDVLRLDLVAPGQQYYERQNQLDMGFRKIFRIGRYQLSGQVDFFNIINSSYVKSQNITIGTSLGQPLDILQPRTMRLAAQLRF